VRKISVIIAVFFLAVSARAAYFVDGAETGTLINSIGGEWVTYNDGYSTISFVPGETGAYAGTYCRRLNWSLNAGVTDQYAGASTGLNAGWTGVDLSAFAGVRFYARGAGSYEVGIGTGQTRAQGNHYTGTLNPSASWLLYEIPFSSLAQVWGTARPWESSTIFLVGFTAVGSAGVSGSLYVDNIEFYTAAEASPPADPNVIILNPKTNQLGFLLDAKKYFTVVTNTANTGDTYRIFDSANNTAVSGTITGPAVNDIAATGEGVYKTDFSRLTAAGIYYVSINGKKSHSFKIAPDVYDRLFKDALRCFYISRCGTSINDPVTGISHPACHTVPDKIRGGTGTRDMSGGWHNAGDFGKWAHMEAITASYMMWLYELKKDKMKNLKNNIPESKNAVSDLLDEAKWGLDWLLKLQNEDGSVYHKSDTEPDFCWGTKPDLDPYTRYVSYQKQDQPQTPSSIDAAVFVAAMSQAARVYEKIFPAFAAKCRAAAVKSYAWLKNNRGIGQSDPFYTDAVSWQEEQWAFAEYYRLTGESEAAALFEADIDINGLQGTGWMTPQFFGYFSIWQDVRTPQALKDKVKARVIAYCDTVAAKAASSGYGVARTFADYYWESNEDVMHSANNMLMAFEMTGAQVYKDAALDQLGYILGNNSLDKSFVTKHGTNYASKPYHWTWYDYGILIPGWASGGPNGYPTGADTPLVELINKGTPPAKCWLDLAAGNGSWASNEGEATENAALLFLSGFFLSEEDAAAGIDITAVPVKNADDVIAYPSPCNMKKGDKGITFFNMPTGAVLQVYDKTGGLVFSTVVDSLDGVYFWNLAGQRNGSKTAPGVYVYSVTKSEGFVKRGKVAIIR
jgi:endoglucanase